MVIPVEGSVATTPAESATVASLWPSKMLFAVSIRFTSLMYEAGSVESFEVPTAREALRDSGRVCDGMKPKIRAIEAAMRGTGRGFVATPSTEMLAVLWARVVLRFHRSGRMSAAQGSSELQRGMQSNHIVGHMSCMGPDMARLQSHQFNSSAAATDFGTLPAGALLGITHSALRRVRPILCPHTARRVHRLRSRT